jgi:hypothetical protein
VAVGAHKVERSSEIDWNNGGHRTTTLSFLIAVVHEDNGVASPVKLSLG